MYIKNGDYYSFVGWAKNEAGFLNEKIYEKGGITARAKELIVEAEEYRKREFEYLREIAATYNLEQLEKIAIMSAEIADVFIMIDPAYLFILGRFVGGVYVFKREY